MPQSGANNYLEKARILLQAKKANGGFDESHEEGISHLVNVPYHTTLRTSAALKALKGIRKVHTIDLATATTALERVCQEVPNKITLKLGVKRGRTADTTPIPTPALKKTKFEPLEPLTASTKQEWERLPDTSDRVYNAAAAQLLALSRRYAGVSGPKFASAACRAWIKERQVKDAERKEIMGGNVQPLMVKGAGKQGKAAGTFPGDHEPKERVEAYEKCVQRGSQSPAPSATEWRGNFPAWDPQRAEYTPWKKAEKAFHVATKALEEKAKVVTATREMEARLAGRALPRTCRVLSAIPHHTRFLLRSQCGDGLGRVNCSPRPAVESLQRYHSGTVGRSKLSEKLKLRHRDHRAVVKVTGEEKPAQKSRIIILKANPRGPASSPPPPPAPRKIRLIVKRPSS
ncbi:uncharacterized protein L3040_005479 [Drepanopeziza brunnea f. sp. 'multigermtubi']|uniref:Uncharacterized protein n=1 Tax=Marssonina brunnea f. sp. multigermtubi (strain MB_m1) TaxID=1072389 RepID=K1XN41_MARBU|nr:uncharacterized protein MBM_08110 [Drepanopeziza brunnea f. sp. 'multigermtubi' MB_m1]EKD13909.1 hypothetical protein MBM_08110 [Drepanopeziza brunnea f. sp. 'multigermtubi' MB_m1]KAJ5040920.1 hypothetical protein L3040_005479 [Drepanopeziza brunnea f. sp. 'multigermtubi']